MTELTIDDFTYYQQPTKKYTFEMPRIKEWTEKRSQGRVLNLFAGKTKLNIDEMRVDASNEFAPDYHGDCREFIKMATNTSEVYDVVLLDPPYTWRKSKEKYEGYMIGQYPRLKDELLPIMSSTGRVISYGWDTVGMGKLRGFKKVGLCVVCHGGDSRDTLIIVEDRIELVDIQRKIKRKANGRIRRV